MEPTAPHLGPSTKGAGCAVMFVLPFAAVGAFMTWQLAGALVQSYAMRGWIEIPAHITRVDLVVNRDGEGDTYETTAEFEYDYGGRRYHSSRVSLIRGRDSVGDFQRRIHRELSAHQTSGQPFRCFVDPHQPDQAVLYRHLRWEMIAFYDLFIVMFGGFGGFGLCGAWYAIREAKSQARLAREHPHEPWLWRADWVDGNVESTGRFWLATTCAAAVAANLATAPLWWLLPPEIISGNFWALMPVPLAALGLGLAISAIVLVRRRLRFGNCIFLMEPIPGAIGGNLTGFIETTRIVVPIDGVKLLLRCQRRGSNGDDSTATTQELWRSEQLVSEDLAETRSGGSSIPVRFAIPENCPPTQDVNKDKIEWRLTAKASSPGVDFKTEFVVPVFKLAGR